MQLILSVSQKFPHTLRYPILIAEPCLKALHQALNNLFVFCLLLAIDTPPEHLLDTFGIRVVKDVIKSVELITGKIYIVVTLVNATFICILFNHEA
jgi:hypothetical protein